ncbi:unnamed protein product [Discula destructiva]
MQPPFPSPTKTWHNDTYDAISPKRKELTAGEKTVVIIGAGSGIGRATAHAFASAGAARLVLLGRREEPLKETAASVSSSVTETAVYAVDGTQEDVLRRIAADIGVWDVLVLCAGHIATPSSIASADAVDWWQSFETNTKGTFLAVHSFLPTANKAKATVLALTTGTSAMPAARLPGMSAYMTSKLAQIKLIEYLAAEQPNVFAATVHPGMVETEIFAKSGANADKLPMDKVELPASFLVWMASPEAAFLKGRNVWANWDVGELMVQEKAISSGSRMTSGINGWPYRPDA